MAKRYNVWIEIEEYDEDTESGEPIPALDIGCTGTFKTLDEACTFATALHTHRHDITTNEHAVLPATIDETMIDERVSERLAQIQQAIREGRIEIGNPAAVAMESHPGDERHAAVSVFDHEAAAGMVIAWAERGTGFGEITIRGDKVSGDWTVDTEEMSPGWCANIFRVIETRMRS